MRQKITILSLQERALKALADDENGAELNVLQVLAGAVISGTEIESNFQLVANAIVAQSVLFGKLPSKKKGRPESSDGVNARDVAEQYYLLRDDGVSYADSVAKISTLFHKDERHIMRLVKEGKPEIGNSSEERTKKRARWKLLADMHQSQIDAGKEPHLDFIVRILEEQRDIDSQRNLIAELDDVIEKVVDRIGIADKNNVTFIASD